MVRKKYRDNGKPTLKLNELQILIKKEIDLKIQQGIYQFELISCCICAGKRFIKISNKDRYGLYMSVVICQNCGLIQTNPRMTQKSYDNFYINEYRKLYNGKVKPTKEFFMEQYRRGEEIYNYLLKNHVIKKSFKKKFIFEVGCGAGGILQYFKEKGYEIKGIDLNEKYIRYGTKNYNLDLEVSKISNVSLKRSPNVIIYSHVLEHILNLKEELNIIYNLLSEEGFLYIEVPGVKNLLKSYDQSFIKYLQNAHTYHFTLRTLINLLKTNGFKMIQGDEYIRSIFKKIRLNDGKIRIISDYKEVISFINRLDNFRIIYFLKDCIKKIHELYNFNLKEIYKKIKNELIRLYKECFFKFSLSNNFL